jgi:hypothetical protein
VRVLIAPLTKALSGDFCGRPARRRAAPLSVCPSSDGRTVAKVVPFGSGDGMRMRTAEDHVVPKPLQMVGPRPQLSHVMRYYGRRRPIGYKHEGSWKPADTFEERAELDSNYDNGIRLWMVWNPPDYEKRSA